MEGRSDGPQARATTRRLNERLGAIRADIEADDLSLLFAQLAAISLR